MRSSLCRLAMAFVLFLSPQFLLSQASRADDRPLTFEEDVAPILQVHCAACHGEAKREAGLDLRRKFTIVSGGDGGSALEPGKPDESLFIEKIVSGEMPPKGEERLSESQIDVLKRWVASGASTKSATEPPLEAVETEVAVTEKDRSHWAFQPAQAVEPPSVKHADRVRTPIDAFLLARLEAAGLTFNPDASRRTLIRRLTFDLHGLPPAPEDVAAFEADTRPDAYERLVDGLLDSPRYGERWARHWLDLAGYADTDGGLDADRPREQAWRYRDYVIRAFNDDKPYAQFVQEQIAGDELSDWRRAAELTDEMRDQLIATGFMRTAVDPTYPIYKEKPEIHKMLADTMQIVGSTFLGVTIQCSRCHQHKSDPLSQRDYYQLLSVVTASYDPEPKRWLASSERMIPLATEAEQARIKQRNEQVDQRVAALNTEVAELTTRFGGKRLREQLQMSLRPLDETFDAAATQQNWIIELTGTAQGWISSPQSGQLVVSDVVADAGRAGIRLGRPVWWNGPFEVEFEFSWTSTDSGPQSNAAMQGVILHLRDGDGNLIASQGYIDENIDQRGSPIGGVNVGADVIAHNLGKYGAAVPPDANARSLAASGTAKVRLTRDANNNVTTRFEDGQRVVESTGVQALPAAYLEIEIYRYVHPGAKFEGISLDRVRVLSPNAPSFSEADQAAIVAAATLPEAQRSAEQKTLLTDRSPRLVVSDSDLGKRFPEFLPERNKIQTAIQSELALRQTIIEIRGLLDLSEQAHPQHVYRRGDYNSLGREVQPGVPAILAGADFQLQPQPGYKTTGRRRAFAEWLVSPAHPTTWRLQANRIWSWHFGRGLAEQLEDFGLQGGRPSHPELLDWLAIEFQKLGGSHKRLHRLILTSTAYRQASAVQPGAETTDPGNVLLWSFRPRRHTGELVRDSVLAVSGQLNLEMYGPGVPVQYQGDSSVVLGDDAAGKRRSVYILVKRTMPVTLLDTFDTPRMEVNCTRRAEATTPMQSLVMLNSPWMAAAAEKFSTRVQAAASDRTARMDYAYQLLYGRSPSTSEIAAMSAFLDEFVRLRLGEAAVTATTVDRAIAESAAWPLLALTLLNTNEFLYVD